MPQCVGLPLERQKNLGLMLQEKLDAKEYEGIERELLNEGYAQCGSSSGVSF
jgi:hypothetical protein